MSVVSSLVANHAPCWDHIFIGGQATVAGLQSASWLWPYFFCRVRARVGFGVRAPKRLLRKRLMWPPVFGNPIEGPHGLTRGLCWPAQAMSAAAASVGSPARRHSG